MDRAGRETRSSTVDVEVPTVSKAAEVADVSFQAFLESRAPPRVQWATAEGFEVVAAGDASRIEPRGEGRFSAARDRASSIFGALDHDGPRIARPRAFGGLAFFPDHESAPPWEGFPATSFVVPEVQLTRAADRTWLTVTASDEVTASDRLTETQDAVEALPAMQPTGGPPGVVGTRQRTPREEWTEQVADAIDRIRSGDLRKVVLATALDADLRDTIEPPAVLERLRRTYPDCYRFLVQPTDAAGFFGAPPERLVRLSGRSIKTEALAGSVKRGETPEEDADLAESLVESGKLQEEQRLVVDAIRDGLAPLGDVSIGEQSVRKLTNIQHLQTPIAAELDRDAHVLSVVEALHPTPAVGGVPRETALEFIGTTEAFERGWYASPVGWFDAAGDGEFAVGIRSGVAGGEWATLFAGNGIVADSDPDEEWTEIGPKYRPILDELDAEEP